MKIEMLADKRDFKAGEVVEVPTVMGEKFIRQGVARKPVKRTAKKKATHKKGAKT